MATVDTRWRSPRKFNIARSAARHILKRADIRDPNRDLHIRVPKSTVHGHPKAERIQIPVDR